MAIIAAELELRKSQVITNDSTNGGRMSINVIASAVKNALWPTITEDQRVAGVSEFRKIFFKIQNDAELAGNNTRIYYDDITGAGTRVKFTAADQRNTQGDLVGSERYYAPGRLATDATGNPSSVVVDVEPGGGADQVIQAGDLLLIKDGATSEFITVSAGGIAWSVDQATITLESALVNSYTAAANTVVTPVYEAGTVQTSFDNFVVVSASDGDFDDIGTPLVLSNLGTIEQTWTLTFSDATNYTITGDVIGSVGAGTTGADFAPDNPDESRPFFTLPNTGFSGTFANGDTIVFQTHPNAVPLFENRITPAGTASFSNDSSTLSIRVESA